MCRNGVDRTMGSFVEITTVKSRRSRVLTLVVQSPNMRGPREWSVEFGRRYRTGEGEVRREGSSGGNVWDYWSFLLRRVPRQGLCSGETNLGSY